MQLAATLDPTLERTDEFLGWLDRDSGPIASVMRSRAAWLAMKWRRNGSTRKTRKYDVARWLENEISDAWTLRHSRETQSLVLRQAAVDLMRQVDTIRVLDLGEIARHVQSNY